MWVLHVIEALSDLPPWWEPLCRGRWAASARLVLGRRCFHRRPPGPASTPSSSEGSSTARTPTHAHKWGKSCNWHSGWSQVKLNNSSLLSHLLSFSLCLNIVKWENVLGTGTVFSLPTAFWESWEIATHVRRSRIAVRHAGLCYFCLTEEPMGLGGRTAGFLLSCTISSVSFSFIFASFLITLSPNTWNPFPSHFSFIITQPHWHSHREGSRGAHWVGLTQINNDCQGITGKSEHNPINHPVSLSYRASSFLSAFFSFCSCVCHLKKGLYSRG